MKLPKTLFVTGIDTDAGKSYATGWLAREIMREGKSVITQKFVQTGNLEFSEDIEVHRRIMGIRPTTEDLLHITAPVIYSYPCSPELAARIDGRPIDFSVIEEASRALEAKYDHLLIEGAGGLMVPLKGEYLTLDYVRDHKLPTVVVTNGALGSINHTLLTLRVLMDAGVEVHSVVYNTYFDKDEKIAADTKDYIRRWMENHLPEAYFIEMPEFV